MKKIVNLDHYSTGFLLIILVVFAGERRAGSFWLPDHFDQLPLNNVSENCHVRKVKCISIKKLKCLWGFQMNKQTFCIKVENI